MAFSSSDADLARLGVELGQALSRAGRVLATAESCTGGWIGQVITAVPGSSAWFDRGFITYSNAAKTELLGVPAELLAAHGAVSEPVVRAMAEGALRASRAQVAVAVTGIAGPDGGTPEKPVGTVWFAWAMTEQPTRAARHQLAGDRDAVRRQSVAIVLRGLLDELARQPEEGKRGRSD